MPDNCILKQFSFCSDGFAAMVFLWRFYLSVDFLWKKAARGCFLEAKVRISKMLWHGTFYNIEKWSLDSLSRITDLHLACVVQTGLLLIYQQDFAWGFGLDSRGWHLHSKKSKQEGENKSPTGTWKAKIYTKFNELPVLLSMGKMSCLPQRFLLLASVVPSWKGCRSGLHSPNWNLENSLAREQSARCWPSWYTPTPCY